jgi:hypothetical protein
MSLTNASVALLTLKQVETGVVMMTDAKHFYSMFLKEKCL